MILIWSYIFYCIFLGSLEEKWTLIWTWRDFQFQINKIIQIEKTWKSDSQHSKTALGPGKLMAIFGGKTKKTYWIWTVLSCSFESALRSLPPTLQKQQRFVPLLSTPKYETSSSPPLWNEDTMTSECACSACNEPSQSGLWQGWWNNNHYY